MEMSTESLRDVAIKLSADQMKNENARGPRERTVFILGSKSVGKSTLLNIMLEKSETPKPTLALDYSFGRRTSHGHGIRRQICHLWELGGGINSNTSALVAVPVNAHGLQHLTVVVMLDLSQPAQLWTDLEAAVSCLNAAVRRHQGLVAARDVAMDRVSLEHVDRHTLDVFPVPVVIVGGKYDVFQDLDPEVKKWVCRSLRCAAHYIGGSLLYYSSKDSGLQKRARDVLNNFGFGSPGSFKGIAQDYNKPLVIPFGGDCWEQIGVTPSSFDQISVMYTTQSPQQARIATLPDDPSTDPSFREPLIDAVRSQKDDELQRLIQENERRKKYGGGAGDVFESQMKL